MTGAGISVEFRLVKPDRSRKHLILGAFFGVMLYLTVLGAEFFRLVVLLNELREKFAFDVVDMDGRGSPFSGSAYMVEPQLAPPPLEGGMVEPGEAPVKPRKVEKPPEKQTPEEKKPRSPEAMNQMVTDWNDGVSKVRTLNVGPVKEQVARLYSLQKEGKIRLFPLTMEVSFRMGGDCTISDIRFKKSSGYPEVDDVALRIIPELKQLCLLLDLIRSDCVTVRIAVDDAVAIELIYDAPDEETARMVMDDAADMRSALIVSLALVGKSRDAQYVMGIELERVGVHMIARSRVPRGDVEKLLLRFIGNPPP